MRSGEWMCSCLQNGIDEAEKRHSFRSGPMQATAALSRNRGSCLKT
jgi:hypothetical protein